MRVRALLKMLMESGRTLSRTYIAKQMGLSESSIRAIIREANTTGIKKGFHVELIRGEGYYLSVLDPDIFDEYIHQQEISEFDPYDTERRLKRLLFLLFQMNGYFTMEHLADQMGVSKTTILRDLRKIEEQLAAYDLVLEKKAHYGMRILGEEQNYRRAFSDFVLASENPAETLKGFSEGNHSFDFSELRKLLKKELSEKQCRMTDTALENTVDHIKVLVFRAQRGNFVTNDLELAGMDQAYHEIAEIVTEWIRRHFDVALPEAEVKLLAAHISGKAVSGNLSMVDRQELLDKIEAILQRIDEEFQTSLLEDEELKEALLIHIFPLLSRMYNNMQLANPLVHEVYSEYANVFLLAFRFSELIEEKEKFRLTIDEISYLALHFAAHFERMKNRTMEAYKRVVVICASSGGSVQLLKMKLESIFTNAIVLTASEEEIADVQKDQPDIVLTAVELNADFGDIPCIRIKNWIDDSEIRRIERIASQSREHRLSSNTTSDLIDLFHEEFYYRNEVENYDELLLKQARDLIRSGYAPEGYDQSVMERESRFATIYKNGVAGPHPMRLNAIRDTVSVAVYDKPFNWKGQPVQIVFLINLQKGHLFLHKEISQLLLKLMEDDEAIRRLVKAKTFYQFKRELEKMK